MKYLVFILLVISGHTFAAGGGSVGSFPSQPVERKTPEQLAVENYNRGISYRDKAWEYEKEATQEDGARATTRLMKKATKAYKSAAKRFRSAVKYEPRLYQAHSSLGYALRKLGNYEASLSAYNQSLELKPDYAEAIEYRAEAWLALGNIEGTKSSYLQLVKLDPERADELMKAIEAWLENPPDNASPDSVADLEAWATERLALSSLVQPGNNAAVTWQDD